MSEPATWAETTPDVRIFQEIDGRDIPESVWVHHCVNAPLSLSRADHWFTQVKSLDALLDSPLAAQIDSDGTGSVTTRMEGALVYVRSYDGGVFVRVTGNPSDVDRVFTRLRDVFPEHELPEDRIRFQFWMHTRHGPRSVTKELFCPNWNEIESNYAEATSAALNGLMREYRPDEAGLLLLWYGPPGTGKTWAIQALARQWNSWCQFDFVSDPEKFFSEADYMLNVLLTEDKAEEKWRALILEDTGELLTADAKMRTGQGLSRLLNLTDGLLGRGSRTLVLITSNEDLRTFHPAVARPGRCGARVPFQHFTRDEVSGWLTRNGVTAVPPLGSMSLADMYGLARGGEVERGKPLVGFAPAQIPVPAAP